MAATCVRLGFWQLDRLQQRKTRNEALAQRGHEPPLEATQLVRDTAGIAYRRVALEGTLDHARTFVLANRTLRGLPGVYVFTPLRSPALPQPVIVNRGWMPAADGTTINLDSLRTEEQAEFVGMILPFPAARSARPDTATTFRRTWFNFESARIRAQLPYEVLPYHVQALPVQGQRAFPIPLRAPEPDNGPHLGYAIQWFSFAVIGIGGWLALVLRRTKEKRED